MSCTREVGALLLLALSIAASRALAEDDFPFVEGPPWQEMEHQLPAYPQDDDLIEFAVDRPGTPFRFLVDGRSVAVGEDGVVRYTVVLSSSSGARNVFNEGIRCATGEFKVYATGDGQGGFAPVPTPIWSRTSNLGSQRYRRVLERTFMCDGKATLKTRVILRRLKYPSSLPVRE